MGFLKNIFGGSDVAKPPAELQQIAQDQYRYAQGVGNQYSETVDWGRQLIPQTVQGYQNAAQFTAPAQQFAQDYSASSRNWYNNHVNNLIPQALGDLGRAGSQARQGFEANMARDDFDAAYAGQIADYNRQLGRAGVSPGSGQYRPNMLQSALGRTQAGNDARYRERMYGEQARQQQLPFLSGLGQSVYADSLGASDAASQQAQYLQRGAMAPASIYGAGLPIGQEYRMGLMTGQEGFGNAWNAQQSYNREKASADRGLWDGISSTVATIAGGFVGGPAGAAAASAATSR